MRTISYQTDVRPHFQRAHYYRQLRFARLCVLREGHERFSNDMNVFGQNETGQLLMLLIEVFAIAIFVAGLLVVELFEPPPAQ